MLRFLNELANKMAKNQRRWQTEMSPCYARGFIETCFDACLVANACCITATPIGLPSNRIY